MLPSAFASSLVLVTVLSQAASKAAAVTKENAYFKRICPPHKNTNKI
jgi:hypothetical protein